MPVAKIRCWTSDDNYIVFLFLDEALQNNAKLANILDKIQNKDVAKTKQEEVVLEEALGTQYRELLELENDIRTQEIKFIYASINPDDNINWLKKKIFAHLHKYKELGITSHEQLYMWLNKHFIVTSQVLLHFVNNVFKNERRVSSDYFRECYANFFGANKLPKEIPSFIDKTQAFLLIENVKKGTHVEPLFFKYTSDMFFEYTNYHPFESASKESPFDTELDTLSVSSYDALLLETVGFHDTIDNCLNLTTYALLHKYAPKSKVVITNKFFPFVETTQSSDYKKSTLDFVEKIEKTEALVRNYPVNDEHTLNTFVNFLHLRTNEINPNKTYDLEPLFEKLVTSEQLPFIKFKTISNNYYKVHKESLGNFKNEVIAKWTDATMSQFSKSDTSYLLIKLRYSQETFCSFLIFDNMCYDVKFTFGNMMRETIPKIQKFLTERIDDIVDVVQSVYTDAYIPKINTDFSITQNIYSNTKIIRWLTFNNIKSDKHNLNYKTFITVLNTRLNSYFNVIKNPNKNILHLQYKKVDNYLKFENIQVFITNHFVKDRQEMVRKIVSEFVITNEDAERELDKWLAQNELEITKVGDRMFIKPKSDNFVNIKIKLTSLIDLTFHIEGAKNSLIHDRITKLMVVLMEMANEKELPEDDATTMINTTKTDDIVYANNESKQHVADFEEIDDEMMGDFGDFGDLSDFGEMFEDDEDLKALEMEFLKEAAAESSVENIVTNGDDDAPVNDANDEDSVMKSYFMNMLKSADRELIDYKVPKGQKVLKRYSTVCQWNDRRQPVVVTKQELDKIKSFQKNIKFIKTGSTKEHYEKNYYICPQVWCPKSKVALTYKDFKEKYNETCPDPDIEEKPVILTNHYWGKGEKGQTREHFPGFLDAKTHPKQLCLPCCFKKEAKEGSKNKQKENTCKMQWSDEPMQEEDTEVFGNEKYIKADIFVPLEVSRYGLLPRAFSEILGGQTCGNGVDGKGLMNDKTNCILRKGISQKSQSFVTAVLSLLDNPDITGYNTFVEYFLTHMTVAKFIGLENGKIMKLFINKEFDIFNADNFTRFVEWFTHDEQSNYIKLFKLTLIKKELEAYKTTSKKLLSFKQDAFKHFKTIIREFLIYNAYIHFIDYVTNPSIEKNHSLLIDFMQTETTWLNTKFYNIVVIEHEPTTGQTNMICPFNRNVANTFDVTDPFVFVFKQNNYYEPLCHIKLKNGDIQLTTKFFLKTAPFNIKRLVQFYLRNCSKESSAHKAHDVATFVRSLGLSIKAYVIDYSFQVCGFLTRTYNMFIPLKDKTDIYDLTDAKFIYYDDLPNYKISVDEKQVDSVITEMFNSLYKTTRDTFYRVNEIIKSRDGKRTIGFTIGDDDYFVPTNYSANATDIDVQQVNEMLQDDLDIFIEYEKRDKRVERIEREALQKRMFKAFTNEISDYIARDKEIQKEFNFLMEKDNPFPAAYKRMKLIELVKRVIDEYNIVAKLHDHYGEDLEKFSWQFVEEVLYRSSTNSHNILLRQLFGLRKRFKKTAAEFVFDQKDVIEGRLGEKLKYIQNPYASLIDRLDRHMKDYVLDFDDKTQTKEQDFFIPYINPTTEFEDVPYKFRKILPEYKLVKYNQNVQYNINTLYDIFLRVAVSKNVSNITNQTIITQVVMKQLVKDYRNGNIDEFLENPSYIFNAKAMALKVTNNIESLISVFESMNYYPSFYELAVLSNLARVNVIVVGRKRKDNAEGIEVFHNKTSRYIILCHSYDRFYHRDVFQLVIKDPTKVTPKVMFRKHELSRPFVEFIEKTVKL